VVNAAVMLPTEPAHIEWLGVVGVVRFGMIAAVFTGLPREFSTVDRTTNSPSRPELLRVLSLVLDNCLYALFSVTTIRCAALF